MHTKVILVAAVCALAFVATAPAAEAAPPDIPEDSCGYFHWHNADLEDGEPPRYHYHPCY